MALVLLIAIINVTNLFLARGTVRARELAVRASLGAGRGRLARHLLAESALLGSLGGGAGVALAYLLLSLVGQAAIRIVPRMEEVRPDGGLVLFALACSLGSGILAGVIPAVRVPWRGLATFLREGGRTAGGGLVAGRRAAGVSTMDTMTRRDDESSEELVIVCTVSSLHRGLPWQRSASTQVSAPVDAGAHAAD